MKRKILMLMLWGFPFCFCGGAEFPEYSFAPSGNEHFAVECYGSELVGGTEWGFPYVDAIRLYINPQIAEGFDSDYLKSIINNPQYSYVVPVIEEYYKKNPDAPNNPFRLSLIDDIGAIMGMILMGVAYGIFAYRVRRQ